jgi:hypothetical protein
MRYQELKKRCTRIMEAFDSLTHHGHEFDFRGSEGIIGGFCMEITGFEKAIESFTKRVYDKLGSEKGTKLENITADLERLLFSVGFGLGYVIGQSFDSPYPEIQKDVEAIRKVLKEEKLLPYFPREKGRMKEGSHEEERATGIL